MTKDSLWDRCVFDGVRSKVFGEIAGTLRAVISTGGALNLPVITPARIVFSVPFINAYTHPTSTAPVLASHPLDLQSFTATDEVGGFEKVAHVGPPGVNVEVKLSGVRDDAVANNGDPVGTLLIRGPSVGKILGVDMKTDGNPIEDSEGWISTGDKAKAQTNGSFKVL
jgi:long-chain acyl-CoA synthetase